MSASYSANSKNKLWLYATSLGYEAAALRESSATVGRIIGVVSGGVYIESLEGYVICLVSKEGVASPLSVKINDFRLVSQALENRVGAKVRISKEGLTIGEDLEVGWRHARKWNAATPDIMGTTEDRDAAIRKLEKALFPFTPKGAERIEGIAGLLEQAIERSTWEAAGEALAALLGAGEGLTPLGDDITMGVIAGLVWRARLGELDERAVRQLAATVSESAAKLTNKISNRLLLYAGHGLLYEPAIELGAALLAGNAGIVQEKMDKLAQIGASTGYGVGLGLLWGQKPPLT